MASSSSVGPKNFGFADVESVSDDDYASDSDGMSADKENNLDAALLEFSDDEF